ncbi:Tripeptidyl-peptidase 2 [Linum perenne]
MERQSASTAKKILKQKQEHEFVEEDPSMLALFGYVILKHPKSEDSSLKRVREDLQNKVDVLRKQAVIMTIRVLLDAVVWHDGEFWRAALDTQSLENDPDCGKLADFVPLTN